MLSRPMPEINEIRYGTVRIRRDLDRAVRLNAEQIDGHRYRFRFLWDMGNDGKYPGEDAWQPADPEYPTTAPAWVASGDIEFDTQL